MLDYYDIDYSDIDKFDFRGSDDDEIFSKIKEDFEVEVLAEELFKRYQETLLDAEVDNIFSVLYSNKNFLYDFNMELASIIQTFKVEEHGEFLKNDGILKRCNYIPTWLSKGVFYRDKGVAKFVVVI